MRSTLRSRTSSCSGPAHERREQRLLLRGRARHQQVVAGVHLRHRVAPAEPVGHHQAVEAPVVAQDARQQRRALRRVGAVQLVVGRHDRPRLRLAHEDLEAAQVDLAQRALRHLHVDDVAVPLVVVGDEVLRRRPDALRLHALDHGGGHPARHQRILGVVLEVAAAERVAVGVERGPEQHVHAVLRRPRCPWRARRARPGPRPTTRPAASRWGTRCSRRCALCRRRAWAGCAARPGRPRGRWRDPEARDRRPSCPRRRARPSLSRRRPAPAGPADAPGRRMPAPTTRLDLLLVRHRGDDVLRRALAQLRQVGAAAATPAARRVRVPMVDRSRPKSSLHPSFGGPPARAARAGER